MDPAGLMRVALLLQVCLTVVFCLPAFGTGHWPVGGALLASAAAFLAGRFGRGRASWPAWGAALLLLGLLPLTLTGEFPLPPGRYDGSAERPDHRSVWFEPGRVV